MSDGLMRLQVTLKSGAQVEFLCTEFSHSHAKLTWTTPADTFPKLVRLDIDEVAAVTRLS